MITPPFAPIQAWKAAEHMLKVPRVSISSTVLKALELNLLADARKFPAAPLIKISSLPKISTHFVTPALQDSAFLMSP